MPLPLDVMPTIMVTTLAYLCKAGQPHRTLAVVGGQEQSSLVAYSLDEQPLCPVGMSEHLCSSHYHGRADVVAAQSKGAISCTAPFRKRCAP